MKLDLLVKKYDLLCSEEYQQIKAFQLDNIIKLANSDINPLILQGMLKVIADTDKWESDFLTEQKKLQK